MTPRRPETVRTSPTGAAPAPTPQELDRLFAARLRSEPSPLLDSRRGDVLFDAGLAGRWTLTVDEGTLTVRRTAAVRPRTTVVSDARTLADVVSGLRSGAYAFLDGAVTVRGDLGLALALDGAFEPSDEVSQEDREQHVRADVVTPLGVPTAYLEAGPPGAPPVILLHGLGATNASLLPLMRDLSRDHRVVAPDLPGFGASAAPRWNYSPRVYVRWLAAFARAAGMRRFAIAGNSLGGRIAIEAGLRLPDRVSGLVLLCPSPAFRRLRQFVPLVRAVPAGLASLAPLPVNHAAVVRGIRAMFAEPERLPDSWYDAGADEFLHVMTDRSHRRAFLSNLMAIYTESSRGPGGFWTRLRRLEVPSLFLWGDRDVLVPSAFAGHVTRAVSTARSIVLDDCGHVPQFEHPELTASLARELLTEIGAAG